MKSQVLGLINHLDRFLVRMDTRTFVQVVLLYTKIHETVRRCYLMSRARAIYEMENDSHDILKTQVRLLGKNSSKYTDFCEMDAQLCDYFLSIDKFGGFNSAKTHFRFDSRPSRLNKWHFSSRRNSLICGQLLECPLPEPQKQFVMFAQLSLSLTIVIFIKHSIITMVRLGWLDETLPCYLPGRLSFLMTPMDHPIATVVITLCMLAYRYIFHFKMQDLELDCFVFLMYSENQVAEKETELRTLNRMNLTIEAKKIFILNSLFYREAENLSGDRMYKLRPHRRLKNWRIMKRFMSLMALYFYTGLFGSILLASYCVWLVTTRDFFLVHYSSCLTNPTSLSVFDWTEGSLYRVIVCFIDIVDNAFMFLECSCILMLSIAASMTIAVDLSTGFFYICKKLDSIKKALEEGLIRGRTKGLEVHIREEIWSVKGCVISLFESIRAVDYFVRNHTGLNMFFWYLTNILYLLLCISRKELLIGNWYVHMVQFFGVVSLTICYYVTSRPAAFAIYMYKKICSVAAYDVYLHTSRLSWEWFYEYYHENSDKSTLHFITKQLSLDFMCYLRTMSLFTSCVLYVMKLIVYV